MERILDMQRVAISSDLVTDTQIQVDIRDDFTIRQVSQSAKYSGQYVTRQQTQEYGLKLEE